MTGIGGILVAGLRDCSEDNGVERLKNVLKKGKLHKKMIKKRN